MWKHRGSILASSSCYNQLVEPLYWVTAITADCPAHSRGCYTSSSAVGDSEDNWGLDSPVLLDKRKMISVVAMSLLGYANSQRANILQVIGV